MAERSYKELVIRMTTQLEQVNTHLVSIDNHFEKLNGQVGSHAVDIESCNGEIQRNSDSVKWLWRFFVLIAVPVIGSIVYLAFS